MARPAAIASIELGAAVAMSSMEDAMAVTLDELRRPIRGLRPDVSGADLDALERAIRRIVLAATLDRNASAGEVRDELRAVVEGADSVAVPERHVGLLVC